MHLERLTFILEVVGQKGEATVAEICAHSDLPKPSAYRLVQDLVSVGLLEPVTRGTFSIGSRLKRITQSDHSDRALLEVIAPALKKAATQYGAAFFLSRLRGKSVEIIHVETPDTGVSYLHPGLGKRPLHACSCSKAVAAFLPELLLTSDMEGRLRAYTEFTLTNVNDLEANSKQSASVVLQNASKRLNAACVPSQRPLRLAGQVLQCPSVLLDRCGFSRQRSATNLEPELPELRRMYRQIWAGILQQTPNCLVNFKVNSQCEPVQNLA